MDGASAWRARHGGRGATRPPAELKAALRGFRSRREPGGVVRTGLRSVYLFRTSFGRNKPTGPPDFVPDFVRTPDSAMAAESLEYIERHMQTTVTAVTFTDY